MPVGLRRAVRARREGDNGGATSPGVTADAIKVVFYAPQQNADATRRAAAGATDSDPEVAADDAAAQVGRRCSTDLYETYGRKVEVETFQATGAATTPPRPAPTPSRSPRRSAFASIGGPTATAYAGRAGPADGHLHRLRCSPCPTQFYQDNAPYVWGADRSTEQYLGNLRLHRRTGARPEGGVRRRPRACADKERVFGVVHYDQDPPVVRRDPRARGRRVRQGPGLRPQGDPDLPARHRQAARAGAGDRRPAEGRRRHDGGVPGRPDHADVPHRSRPRRRTTSRSGSSPARSSPTRRPLARLYDQEQWTHAFGVSSLPARTRGASPAPTSCTSGTSASRRSPRPTGSILRPS